jgi:hypothetical protein
MDKDLNSGGNETEISVRAQENRKGSTEIQHCWREAWKDPLPFQSGTNTLANIFNLNTERWWFRASRDEYQFFLGSRSEPFYTIELIPAELRTSQTSTFEWTVVQKTWASNEALKELGYMYREDSAGHFWIQKQLNWVCSPQIGIAE